MVELLPDLVFDGEEALVEAQLAEMAGAVELDRVVELDPPGRGDMTMTRSASSTASLRSWVTKMTVLPDPSHSSQELRSAP